MTDDDAGLHAVLYTEHGGRLLDLIDHEIARRCADHGAARADDVTAAVPGHRETKRAALDYLVEAGHVREVNPPGTHRILVTQA